MDSDSLEHLYEHCIAHDKNNNAPTRKEVMKRFLAHVNGIISVGEVLVDSEHVSADGIAILRKALDPVQDALKDDSIKLGASSAAPSEKAGTQTKKRKAAEQETDKDVMFLESTPPPTSPTSDNDRLPDTIVKSLAPISPSGRGNEWLRCWTNIVKSIPSNATTNKPAVWPGLITKILIHAFGYDGVNNTIALAEHVLNNYDMLTIDDITSADGDAESPLRPLAIRLKQVWASSRGPAIATADAICYYNLMAEDFDRLEQDIDDLETAMGQEWTARDSRLAQTPQARLNFIITRVFAYLHPGTLTQKERDFRLTSLRKERMMARNIALMVKLFGIGIVPLIAKSPWRQAFAQYAAASSEQFLKRLLEECPVLREICDRVDKNFFQYLRKKGEISQLPRNCINGLVVDASLRRNHTISFLLAAPGESEEPGNFVTEGTRMIATKGKSDGKKSEKSKKSIASDVEEDTSGEDLAFLEG